LRLSNYENRDGSTTVPVSFYTAFARRHIIWRALITRNRFAHDVLSPGQATKLLKGTSIISNPAAKYRSRNSPLTKFADKGFKPRRKISELSRWASSPMVSLRMASGAQTRRIPVSVFGSPRATALSKLPQGKCTRTSLAMPFSSTGRSSRAACMNRALGSPPFEVFRQIFSDIFSSARALASTPM